MKKIRLFCVTLLLFFCSLFSFTSCNKQSKQVDYLIKKDQESTSLVINVDNFKKDYQTQEEIDFSTIKVYFNNQELKFAQKVDESYATTFFISSSDSDPLSSVLENKSTVSGSNRQNNINIYVCHKEIENQNTTVYLQTITLSVTNPSAVDKWIIYLIMGLVFITFAAFAYLKSYKDKKKKKMMQVTPSNQNESKIDDNKKETLEVKEDIKQEISNQNKKEESSDEDEEVK